MDDGKQRAILLSACGASTYQVIRNLTAPKKPAEHPFKDIVELVRQHYSPAPSAIVQRFNFNTRSQKEGETVAEFIADLRKISEHCQFGDTLEDMLRDRLVCGIRDSRLQRRLLAEIDLTFTKAFDLCQATELAEKNAQSLQGQQKPTVMTLHRGGQKPPQKTKSNHVCYRCRNTQHLVRNCPFKGAECHSCKKKGHLAKVCRSKTRSTNRPQPERSQTKKNTHLFSMDEPEEDDVLFRMTTPRAPPIQVILNLNGIDIPMEVDTGASLSVMSATTFKATWKTDPPRLHPSNVHLKTYTGEQLAVCGSINVRVKYQDQTVDLSLTIVDETGPTLLGRDWLQKIKLKWENIAKLSTADGGCSHQA